LPGRVERSRGRILYAACTRAGGLLIG